MVFGQSKKLLSIVIPTWNRANTLSSSLELLLEQVMEFDEIVEIVITDNASDDNTPDVIEKYVDKYANVDFVLNRNDVNLGFYGNFKIGRELSTGKYIWLLSDDDHVINPHLLKDIIEILNKKDCDSIYLDTRNGKKSIRKMSTKDMLYEYTCLLTLISTIIFRNNKDNDNQIYRKYKNNSFLGFLFFMSSVNLESGISYIYTDECFSKGMAKPAGYNWFDVFINQHLDTLEYLIELGIESDFVDKYKTDTLKYHIRKTYLIYKIQNKIDSGNFTYSSLDTINKSLYRRFWNNLYFVLFVLPIIISPAIILSVLFKVYNSRNY